MTTKIKAIKLLAKQVPTLPEDVVNKLAEFETSTAEQDAQLVPHLHEMGGLFDLAGLRYCLYSRSDLVELVGEPTVKLLGLGDGLVSPAQLLGKPVIIVNMDTVVTGRDWAPLAYWASTIVSVSLGLIDLSDIKVPDGTAMIDYYKGNPWVTKTVLNCNPEMLGNTVEAAGGGYKLGLLQELLNELREDDLNGYAEHYISELRHKWTKELRDTTVTSQKSEADAKLEKSVDDLVKFFKASI
jgi:hypothetical protein